MKKKVAEKVVKKVAEKAKKSRRLLTQADLDVVKFFGTKEKTSRYMLQYLHITEERVEATDGKILCQLSASMADPDEFPATDGEGFTEKPNILIPSDALSKIKLPTKIVLPILRHVCLTKNGEKTVLHVNDLVSPQANELRLPDAAEGEFPETESVIPKIENENAIEFTLDARILNQLTDFVCKNQKGPAPVTFRILKTFTRDEGILFTFRLSETEQDGSGVIMPIKL